MPFYKLFTFVDTTDKILMFVGSISGVGSGICFPIMTVFSGELVDAFGNNQNTPDVVYTVSKVALEFMYLTIGVAIAACLFKHHCPTTFEVSCWMVTGERHAARIRNLYMKAIILQDVSFFDKETNLGEVVGRMSGDTVLIQDAMGEKVEIVGGGMSIMITKASTSGQNAYAKASIIVEQSIGAVRTVVSFTGEKQVVTNYKRLLYVHMNQVFIRIEFWVFDKIM